RGGDYGQRSAWRLNDALGDVNDVAGFKENGGVVGDVRSASADEAVDVDRDGGHLTFRGGASNDDGGAFGNVSEAAGLGDEFDDGEGRFDGEQVATGSFHLTGDGDFARG